jgi:hypothetical protein
VPDRQLDRALEHRLVQVVAAPLAGLTLHVEAGGGEYPLPGPLAAGVGVLARQRARQLDPARATPQVLVVLLLDQELAPAGSTK